MGVLTSSGSFARFTGPIFVTSIYNNYGPSVTFSVVVGSMTLALITSALFYRRLVPLKVENETVLQKHSLLFIIRVFY